MLESAVSQCVIIFDWIRHTPIVYSKTNFVLGSLTQFYSSCKHCDNSKLFSKLSLTTPYYSIKQNKVFQTSHLNPCLFSTGFYTLFTLYTKLNSISSYNYWGTWNWSEGSLFFVSGNTDLKHSLKFLSLLLQKNNYCNTHIEEKKKINKIHFKLTCIFS